MCFVTPFSDNIRRAPEYNGFRCEESAFPVSIKNILTEETMEIGNSRPYRARNFFSGIGKNDAGILGLSKARTANLIPVLGCRFETGWQLRSAAIVQLVERTR